MNKNKRTTHNLNTQNNEEKMKYLLSITAIFLMFFIGCSKDVNINSPIESDAAQILNKGGNPSNLPLRFVSISKEINGATGGMLSINQNALSSEGRVIEVDAQFQLQSGAFVGTQVISMTVDVDSGTVKFSPHMDFNLKCFFNYSLHNMNLANLGFTSSDTRQNSFTLMIPVPLNQY